MRAQFCTQIFSLIKPNFLRVYPSAHIRQINPRWIIIWRQA